jgi:hypothetical protein
MKLSTTIPALRLPELPSFQVPRWNPKVRIPFLSLLLEPRSLKKWLFMWGFGLYLVFCWWTYFKWEQPRLAHDNYVRFGADSPTYWEAVEHREQHAADSSNTLVSFSGNLLGPVLIGLTFRTGVGVAFFNIFLFFVTIEVACTLPGVDRYRFLFLMALCSETVPALVTLNKEILVFFTAVLMAKYIYDDKHSKILLAIALFFSIFARWEQIAIILLFIFLQRKGSILKRNPRLSLLFVVLVLTVVYGLIARLPGSGIGAFTQYAAGANTIAKLNALQTNFGFPLVVVPKIIMDLFGELLRPLTFVKGYAERGTGDIHSMFIIPLFSIAFISLLWVAYRRRLLTLRNPAMLLMMIYMMVTAIAPFVQPRYNFFGYVLVALELSKVRDRADETAPREPVGAIS